MVGNKTRAAIGECQHKQERDHAAAGKIPAKDEPKREDDIRQGCDWLLQPHWESLGAEKSNRYEKNQPSREDEPQRRISKAGLAWLVPVNRVVWGPLDLCQIHTSLSLPREEADKRSCKTMAFPVKIRRPPGALRGSREGKG